MMKMIQQKLLKDLLALFTMTHMILTSVNNIKHHLVTVIVVFQLFANLHRSLIMTTANVSALKRSAYQDITLILKHVNASVLKVLIWIRNG